MSKPSLTDNTDSFYTEELKVKRPFFSEQRHLITAVVFLVILLTALGLWWIVEAHERKELVQISEISVEQVSTRLQSYLDTRLEVLRYLRKKWLQKTKISSEEFVAMVLPIVEEYRGFQAINYIDPGGVIRWVVPESPNLPAKGKNLRTHPYAAKSFILSEQTGNDIMTPILKLWQGGVGFATYFPILRKGYLEGYLNGVFRVDHLLRGSWCDKIEANFIVQLVNEGNVFFSNTDTTGINNRNFRSEANFSVLNQQWTVRLIAKPELLSNIDSYLKIYILLFGTILAFVVAGLTHRQLSRQFELHKGLRKIHESEVQHRQLIEHSPDGILIHQKGKIVFVNEAFVKMMKAGHADELLGIPFLEVVHPDYRAQVQDRIRTVIEQRVEVGSVELKYIARDGECIDVEVSAIPVTYKDMPAAEVVVHNVTERKKAEKLQAVVYRISQATVTSKDLNELFVSIHQNLSTVLDTTNFYIALRDEKTDLLSFPYYVDREDPTPDPSKPRKGLSEYVMRAKTPLMIDEQGIYELEREGKIELIGTPSKLWLGAPLIVQDKVIGVMVVQCYNDIKRYTKADLDILTYTSEQVAIALQRKQADEQIRRSEQRYREVAEELSRSNTMKEMLLDVISHDLRNPAGVIHGMSEILEAEDPENEMIGLIRDSSKDLLSVIENAVILSKVALGEKIEKETIDIKALLNSVIQGYRQSLKEAGMELEMNIPEGLKVLANPIIMEVFKNYINNAIKYASEGKHIIVEIETEDGYMIGKVRDFGKTLPKKHWKEVFERSIRLKSGDSRGRGLGLAIVQRIAEAHQGEVWVEPNRPHGNSFCIRIPMS